MDFEFGKPLEGKGGPIDRMEKKEIVVIGRLLLPDLVLLIDDHLLLLVEF
jgi:hypothetical protein